MYNQRKNGLSYLPLNTDWYRDEELEIIRCKYGLVGLGIINIVYCKAFDIGGFYTPWNDKMSRILAVYLGIDKALLDDIISTAIEHDIFDPDIYHRYDVLTSEGLQLLYVGIVKKLRRDLRLVREYMLLDEDSLISLSPKKNIVWETIGVHDFSSIENEFDSFSGFPDENIRLRERAEKAKREFNRRRNKRIQMLEKKVEKNENEIRETKEQIAPFLQNTEE